MIIPSLILIGICIAQNTAFSLVSRSRNRDNLLYHAGAAVLSNGIWFATMKYMIDLEFLGWLVVPYVVGTVTGSLLGAKISMFIERLIGATSDGHLKKKDETTDILERLKKLEDHTFLVISSQRTVK